MIREHIQVIDPYQSVKPLDKLARELGLDRASLVKLDANENPFGLHPSIREALSMAPDYHIYPDPEGMELLEKIAEVDQVPIEQIVLGAGADEIIDLLCRLMIEPGDAVIDAPPSFGVYRFDVAINAGKYVSVPRKANFELDIPAIEKAVEAHQAKIIFLTSPNNPTGNLIPEDQLNALLKLPALLVLDEAYIQFADTDLDWCQKVDQFENLILVRTFSKWAALAGLRVGYGIMPSLFRENMMKIKQPYNLSYPAFVAAKAALDNLDPLMDQVNQIKQERGRLQTELSALDWMEVHPSQANFILMRVKLGQAFSLWNWLRARGFLLRYFDQPGLSQMLRVSVGRAQDTDRLLAALKEYSNEIS